MYMYTTATARSDENVRTMALTNTPEVHSGTVTARSWGFPRNIGVMVMVTIAIIIRGIISTATLTRPSAIPMATATCPAAPATHASTVISLARRTCCGE